MSETTTQVCANCGRAIAASETSVRLSDASIVCTDCVKKAIDDVTLQPTSRYRRARTVEVEQAKPRDAVLDFIRRQREFALMHRIDPDNWESDYLAKSDDERQQTARDWLAFLRAFSADFRGR